jgi:drug/metabolite transporter (DMT)-like permease
MNKQKTIGAVLVLLGAICFSSKAIFAKLLYKQEIDMISVVALRMIFSCPFFMLALLFSNRQKYQPQRRHWISLIILGFLGHYLAVVFNFAGLQFVSARTERIILFLYPTMVVLISAWVLRRRIYFIQWLALIITYLGILIVFMDNLNTDEKSSGFIQGFILIFFSGFTYACFLVGSEKLIPRFGTTRFTVYSLLISTLLVLIHYRFYHVWGDLFLFSNEQYALLIGMALIATVAPSFLLSAGIKRLGAGNASIISSVGPLSTIFLSYSILSERIGWVQILGTAIVLSGVILITWRESRANAVD